MKEWKWKKRNLLYIFFVQLESCLLICDWFNCNYFWDFFH